MASPLLGVMEYDPNAPSWKDVFFERDGSIGGLAQSWLQDAGGFAAVGLLVWVIYVLATPSPAVAGSRRKLISKFMAVTGVLALITYLVWAGFVVTTNIEKKQRYEAAGVTSEQQQQIEKQEREQGKQRLREKMEQGVDPRSFAERWRERTLAIAGLFALLAVCEPFFLDFARLRWRRIFALAKLSFKEAVRRRVVWVFLLFLIVILFPTSWFLPRSAKPEDALKATINVNSTLMTVMLIATALLLAGFSIPTDVKNQTIHTIVTKPVERFEVVMGRFLGYLTLLTIALVALTGVSLLFIFTSNISPKAIEESRKARVVVYGKLEFLKERFQNRQRESKAFEGIDVGKEYSYRHFIAGGPLTTHRAIWSFTDPSELKRLAELPAVPMQFAFDVYRTTKGVENKGIECTFEMTTWKWDAAREDEYVKEYSAANQKSNDVEKAELLNAIAEKYGRYDHKNFPIHDYHTYTLNVPTGLIRNAISESPATESLLKNQRGSAYLQIKLKCESPSQFIGVAEYDLYFLESEGNFWLNYFKGAIGLWCRLAIVIGLAVAASTYLAGVVSFLIALFLFLGGYFQDFLRSVASDTNVGGGPFESFHRLVKGQTSAGELDKTPTVQASLFGDEIYRWLLNRFLNVVPDAERFTWSNYLVQGFSIRPDFILLNLLFLVAYMLPWAVLAYYLMRSREIAA
jgi:hypothetical protein